MSVKRLEWKCQVQLETSMVLKCLKQRYIREEPQENRYRIGLSVVYVVAKRTAF